MGNERGRPARGCRRQFQFQADSESCSQRRRVRRPSCPRWIDVCPSGAELWRYGGKYFLAGRAKLGNHFLAGGTKCPRRFSDRIQEIEAQTQAYGLQRQQLRTYKTQMLLTLVALHDPPDVLSHMVCTFPVQAGYGADSGAGGGDTGNHCWEFRDARERPGAG